jgi:creatinine amidohydrolase
MKPFTAASFRLARLLALLLLLAAPAAQAQAPASVFLEDLTWTELRDQIRAGRTTILVPIGGVEENGPHMALGKHNVRVRLLAEKIALALGNALVAPVVGYVPEGGVSPPTQHMRFPGTITIPDAAFEATLEYAGLSFKLHGFRDVVFLGDHGGYQRNEVRVADRLNRAWAASPVRAHAITVYYEVAGADYARLLTSRGYSQAEIGTHAGLDDTSLMLALDARLVRSERLRAGPSPGPALGVYGDPRRASAALGQLGVDLIVRRSVDAIRAATIRR